MTFIFIFIVFASTCYSQPFRANVCSFGAIANDKKDDTEAIEKAVQWANKHISAFKPKSSSYIGCSPVVYFPPGKYRLKRQITTSGYTSICSDSGKAIIEWIEDATLDDDKKKAMFLFKHCYTNKIENIKFIGGNTHLHFQNKNTDKTVLDISGCEFYLAKDIAIRATPMKGANHLSALLTIRNCKFTHNHQCLETYCDITRLTDTWVAVNAPQAAMHGAVIINKGGNLILDNMVGVPGVCKDLKVKQEVHQLRWVDNYGNFQAIFTRFGGEGAGMPIVYNFAKNNGKYPYMTGGLISITQSTLCTGSLRSDACVMRLYEVPSMIVLRENSYMVNAPIMRIDKSLDIDTWLAKIPLDKQNFVYVIEHNRTWPPLLKTTIPKSLQKFVQ